MLVCSALVGLMAGKLYLQAAKGDESGIAAPSDTAGQGRGGVVAEYPPTQRGGSVVVGGTTLQGGQISTDKMRGDVVVVNVWGSWCAPCRTEAPILADASRRYQPRGVSFLGINVRDNEAAAKAFEDRYSIRYPSIADFDGRTLLSLNDYVPASAVPVTVILDRDGRVAARVLGELRRATLDALLDTVIAEPARDLSTS
ncbi:TlpA family protein disulfide reductase [Nocardioides caldifontis]|uniref:TlpA family protein disulfide reductase n=1 Tax=Nocardioides caldifontis TaxID=2588938 RepID=UPI00193A6E4A|nr:TlpA disulfide reductase family protein [Nocardioides caldifontis]